MDIPATTQGATRDLIVIGASAGGVEPLRTIVASLPPSLPAAVCIVLHVGTNRSVLPDILARASDLTVADAIDGQPLRRGHVYVAPPDVHLTLAPGVMRVARSAKENLVRPAIDPLFRTAAVAYGPRAIGVLLSGSMDDGVAGLLGIARAGGITIVQSPDDAVDPTLPRNALEVLQPTRVMQASGIAAALVALAGTPVGDRGAASLRDVKEVDIVNGIANPQEMDEIGKRSVLTCPECHGVLWEIEQEGAPRYRCHTGHAFTANTLLEGQRESVETALWSAIRALRENAELADRLAARARSNQHVDVAERFAQRARRANEQADVLVQLAREPQQPAG